MEKSSNNKRDQGFTLLEIMIGIAIFSVGIMGVAAMQTTATTANSLAGKATSDLSWAIDRSEALLGLPYDHELLTAGTHSVAVGNLTMSTDGIDNDSDGQVDEAGEGGNINIEWRVTDNLPVNNTKTVDITVSRTGLAEHSITLTQVIPEII